MFNMERNIQHFNPQSLVTGPKNSNVVFRGVFDMSLKMLNLLSEKVAGTRLSVPLPRASFLQGDVCPRQ